MTITDKKVVLIHYTLKDKTGKVLDSSKGNDPLAYIQGIGNLVIGLEEELAGKAVGDKLNTTVKPEKGYGERNDQNIHKVPLSGFQADGDEKLEAGMQVRVETNEGISIADVASIEGEEVTLDLNHPLAGVALNFDINILSVREATKEELDHGHTHEDGHSH